MGTSTNHSSPALPSWRLVKSVLGREDVSVDRQSVEIWKAAFTDNTVQLKERLSDSFFAHAADIAREAKSPGDAVKAYDRLVLNQRHTGLFVELARRALARAVIAQSGTQGFAAELVAETVSYYASRDLPSFTGARSRIRSASEAISLKNNLVRIAKQTAERAGLPANSKEWKQFVSKVVIELQGRRQRG